MPQAINIGADRDFFNPRRAPAYGQNGACATSHPFSSVEAIRILQFGGSAVDAAIAAMAVQCVVEPHMTGVGGDCFALVKAPGEEKPLAINGSGWAPRDVSIERIKKAGGLSQTSPHSVTVPGAVAAWRKLHKKFGKLDWGELFTTAIGYAEQGFLVTPKVAKSWQTEQKMLKTHHATAQNFLKDGRAPQSGEIFKLPLLGSTLRSIAGDGGECFYRGRIARDMVGALNELGGDHSVEDFADYAEDGAKWVEPICGKYRDWNVWECPPNGQGVVALMLLAAMDGHMPEDEAQAIHFFAEITRPIYAWRDTMLGERTEHDWRAFFEESGKKARAEVGATAKGAVPQAAVEHKDTAYLATADSDGMVVSFINSLFYAFGGGITGPQSGVLLQNRGMYFALDESHANAIAPRKRPMHTIIPAIVENGRGDTLALGVTGGFYQPVGQAWVLSRLFDRSEHLQEALDAPRVFNYPDALYLEPTIGRETVQKLRKMGHKIALDGVPMGGAQAVHRRKDGLLIAASESRKDGVALGY